MSSENRISNYEITKYRVQGDFLKYDQEKMIEKFSLKSDEQYLYINFIGHLYRINRQTALLEWSEDGFVTCVEGDFNEALTIYDLLCDSKENCKASGEYVNLQSLSALQSSSKKLGDGLFHGKDKVFDHKEELLSEICEKLGGKRAGKGDVAYEIPWFDYISCRIQFWNSDEDFDAQMQIFMDKNILDFIRYETVWYAVGHLMRRLTEELDGSYAKDCGRRDCI
jgi:hypothetical protein